jgi:hypothetical protein
VSNTLIRTTHLSSKKDKKDKNKLSKYRIMTILSQKISLQKQYKKTRVSRNKLYQPISQNQKDKKNQPVLAH